MEDGMFDCQSCLNDKTELSPCRHCRPGLRHGTNWKTCHNAVPPIDWQSRAERAEAAQDEFARLARAVVYAARKEAPKDHINQHIFLPSETTEALMDALALHADAVAKR